jgi:hypothetical protein
VTRPGTSGRGSVRVLAAHTLLVAVAAVSACTPKVASLPSGSGAPFPEAANAYARATERCRGVRTFSAELALSGRVSGHKLRGRILAGLAEPSQLRLEAPAPFGRPVFILVARGQEATLVLSRDRRVLRGVAPDAIIEALTGVAIGPDDLRAAIAGCGLGDAATTTAGVSYPGDWVAIDSGAARSWLRRVSGAWRLVASTRGALEIRYERFDGDRPSEVRLRGAGQQGAPRADLLVGISQVEINVPLTQEVFDVDVPADATPLTLEELRRNGPLGESSDKPSDEHPSGTS